MLSRTRILTRLTRLPCSGHIARWLCGGRRGRGRQRVILAYHGVSNQPAPNCVTEENLEQQLFEAGRCYRFVSLETLVRSLGDERGADLLAVTFDDGYANVLTYGYPVLRHLGIPATIFVVSGCVGRRDLTWQASASLSDWTELSRLDRRVITFGSHGLSHRRLVNLPPSELRAEIVDSRAMIEDRLGVLVDTFSYPFGLRGDFDRRAVEVLGEAGFAAACSSMWGRYNRRHDRFLLRRLTVWDHDTLADFKRKLAGDFDWLSPKEALAHGVRQSYRLPILLARQAQRAATLAR